MVKLTDPRKTVEITLPSFPESKVVLYKQLLIAEQVALQEKYPQQELSRADDTKLLLETIVKSIKSWNFTEDDEKTPLPITMENLSRFPDNDVEAMFEAQSGIKVRDPETGRPYTKEEIAAQKKSLGQKS